MSSDLLLHLPVAQTPGVRISDVIVGDRARRDYGDIDALMESIKTHGLLQPIGLTNDNRLIFGGRRMEACRRLGWDAIPCTRPQSLTDTLALLTAERDENTCRKEMTPSELVALGKAIEEQERPKAAERQAHGQTAPGRPLACRTGTTSDERHARTDEVVGAGLGISGSNYQRAKRLTEAAAAGDPVAVEAVERMDRTGSITPAYNDWRRKQSAPTATDEPDKADRARMRGTPERLEKIRELASRGASSAQIATAVDMSGEGLRLLCRREGITIPADKVVARTRRLDANRVVEQTVRAAEPSTELLAAIDYGALDRNNLGEWISSLSESVKALRSLKTALEKELFRDTD